MNDRVVTGICLYFMTSAFPTLVCTAYNWDFCVLYWWDQISHKMWLSLYLCINEMILLHEANSCLLCCVVKFHV